MSANAETEDVKSIELTQSDRDVILFALGGLAAMAFRDADNKPNPLSEQALQVARKFGVTL